MIDITKHNYLKYFLFGSLYFSEGLELILATVIIPVYFVEKGIPLQTITFVSGISAMPWVFKFACGMIIDHFIQSGRKAFILIGGLIGSTGLFSLALVDPSTSLILFAFLVFVSHIGVVFIDVSSDAWAIQSSTTNERGKINGAMTTGLFTGMTVGALLFSYTAEVFSYSSAFLTAGLLMLMILLFPFFTNETKIIRRYQKITSTLINEFKKKTTLLAATFSPIVSINAGILMFIIPLYMKTILHLNVDQIGFITAIFPINIVIGSLIGGVMTDHWGRKIILYIFIFTTIPLTIALIFANTWQVLAVIYGFIGFLQGGYFYAAFSAMLMDITNPKIGATQYSILTSLANFGEIGAGTLSGFLISMLGFTRVFLYSAWALGPALLILYFIQIKKHSN